MLRWAQDAWKRHKRKIYFVAGAAAAGYAAKKYLEWKLDAMQQQAMTRQLFLTRQHHHFQSNQKSCDATVVLLLPKLFEDLKGLQDTEALLLQLKQGKCDKVQTWEELKLVSTARAIACVYASSLLFLLLRLQSNILGGYMFQTLSAPEGDGDVDGRGAGRGKVLSSEVQSKYLRLAEWLTGAGLEGLVGHIAVVVRQNVAPVSLKQLLARNDLASLLQRVRDVVENQQGDVRQFLGLGTVDGCGDDADYDTLLLETQDVVDTEAFAHALGVCLDIGFEQLLDQVAGQLATEDFPFAKLVPKLSTSCQVLLHTPDNPLVQAFAAAAPVKRFCQSVYESFCSSPGP
eukprot:m.29264 g.29264  ORF g.29264 m.29264 type:complete len:345 (+) comp9083_c0_seq1:153-1187(+)